MSSDRIPRRPRLAAHVLARRHVVEGREQVILHDQRRDEVLQIGPREWALLEAADGTRELEGIVVAARREGAHARVAAVGELLATLWARGMVEAGEEADEVERGAAGSAAGDAVGRESEAEGERRLEPEGERASDRSRGARRGSVRRLVPLPGEGLRCDGAGTCCRLYGTVMLLPDEARRVRSLLPQWRVGTVPPERWFTPVRGSEPGPVLAAIARDGACGFLRDDGLCAVHREGGAAAKPWGCRSFPRTFVDDGVAVHVSAKPECPCVLDPRGGEPEPLVDPAWIDASALPSTVVVRVLPDAIELRGGCWAARDRVRAWMAEVSARAVPSDPAAAMWALADRIEHEGRLPETEGALDEAWRGPPPSTTAVGPWLRALHRRATARAREHAAWRAERDLVRRITTALATVTLLLRDDEALAEALAVPTEHPGQEARYWRMGVHGYRWLGRAAMVTALRDEAVRLWAARSLPVVLPGAAHDPDLRAPLALVEAMLRAYGIGAYTDDVGQNV